jgi:hypothetical protein
VIRSASRIGPTWANKRQVIALLALLAPVPVH